MANNVSPVILSAMDLEVHFGEQVVLDKASLSVHASDRIGLVGRNGSGKSTFLKIISGYEFKKQNTKNWIWNWLMLKSETKRGNINITVVAKNIEENVFIADTVFSPPLNILIIEVDLEDLRNQEGEINPD